MQTPSFSLSDDTRHFLAYVPWRTILDWRRAEVKAGRLHKGNQLKPFAYATRIGKAYEYLSEGDIIWIFTIPYYGHYGSLPSLNAMLMVEGKMDREEEESKQRSIPAYLEEEEDQQLWRYIFLGDQQLSSYFPINNCLELLMPLLSKKAAHNLDSKKQKGYGYLGMVLQHGKKLSPEQGRQFYEFQQHLGKRKTLFISCQHQEESEILDRLVEGLLEARVNCWLDVNRIPGAATGEEGNQHGEPFKAELLSAVEECDGLLALESDGYWQSFWTGLEYGAAQVLADAKPGFQFFEADLSSLSSKKKRRRLIERVGQSIDSQAQVERKRSSDGVK